MLLCRSFFNKCLTLRAGLTQGKRNYSALLSAGLFSLDWLQSARCLDTAVLRGLCTPCPPGSCTLLLKQAFGGVLFHLSACHQLIHNVPRGPFCSPSRSCTHKQAGKHKLAYAHSPGRHNAYIYTPGELKCSLLINFL